jgi:hypothetical protein
VETRPPDPAAGICAGRAVTLPILLFSQILLAPVVENALCQQSFDPKRWREDDRSDNECPARLSMIDDLLETTRLDGLEGSHVIALLGEPDVTEYFKDWDFVYHLGPERGWIRIDSEWLLLRLDPDGRVHVHALMND